MGSALLYNLGIVHTDQRVLGFVSLYIGKNVRLSYDQGKILFIKKEELI